MCTWTLLWTKPSKAPQWLVYDLSSLSLTVSPLFSGMLAIVLLDRDRTTLDGGDDETKEGNNVRSTKDKDIGSGSARSGGRSSRSQRKILTGEMKLSLQREAETFQLLLGDGDASGSSQCDGETDASAHEEFILESVRKMLVACTGSRRRMDGHKFRSFVQRHNLLGENTLLTDVDAIYQRMIRKKREESDGCGDNILTGDYVDMLLDIIQRDDENALERLRRLAT